MTNHQALIRQQQELFAMHSTTDAGDTLILRCQVLKKIAQPSHPMGSSEQPGQGQNPKIRC